jgi:hypothetical protein
MGCDMKGFAEGVVKTSTAMRAFALQDALNCRQCLLGSWKEHQAKTTDSRIKIIQRFREILCCAFEGFDWREFCARPLP